MNLPWSPLSVEFGLVIQPGKQWANLAMPENKEITINKTTCKYLIFLLYLKKYTVLVNRPIRSQKWIGVQGRAWLVVADSLFSNLSTSLDISEKAPWQTWDCGQTFLSCYAATWTSTLQFMSSILPSVKGWLNKTTKESCIVQVNPTVFNNPEHIDHIPLTFVMHPLH